MIEDLGIISAMDLGRGIGKRGALPWAIPSDMERFKRMTMGGVVIMGRATWRSLPERVKPLAGRMNIVLSRSRSFKPLGAYLARSLDEALEVSEGKGYRWIIGGESLYAQALPQATRLAITHVLASYPGCDTFFPEFDVTEWAVAYSMHHRAKGDPVATRFIDMVRKDLIEDVDMLPALAAHFVANPTHLGGAPCAR